MKVLVTQSCPTPYDPIDCHPPGSSVHGMLQARILEWVAIPFSRGSSWPRDQNSVSCTVGRFFTIWATNWERLKDSHFFLRRKQSHQQQYIWSAAQLIMSMFRQKKTWTVPSHRRGRSGVGFSLPGGGLKSEFTLRDRFSTALRVRSKSKIPSAFFPGVLKAAVPLITNYDSNLWKNW